MDRSSKRKRHETVAISYGDPSRHYILDKGDYDVLCEILSLQGEKAKKEVSRKIGKGDIVDERVEKLWLDLSSKVSLSPMIRGLDNLRVLYLNCSTSLVRLPHEIEDLASLTTLSLSYCSSLEEIPDSIGNLTNLRSVCLEGSGVNSLPDSLFNLKELRCMILNYTPIIKNNPKGPSPFIWELIKNCHSLGYIGCRVYPSNKKLLFALACNRARVRMGFHTLGSTPMAPSLWPFAICKVARCFREYSITEINGLGGCPNYRVEYDSDAIYQLLVDRRESFLELLIHRNNTIS